MRRSMEWLRAALLVVAALAAVPGTAEPVPGTSQYGTPQAGPFTIDAGPYFRGGGYPATMPAAPFRVTAPSSALVYSCDYTAGALCGAETFARAGNATMFDSTGALTFAPNNLFLWSSDLTNAAWSVKNQVTLTSGYTDPLGGTAATRVQGTGSTWYIAQTPVAYGNSLIGVWIKSNTGSNQKVRLFYNSSTFSSEFSVTTAWQQIYIVATSSSGAAGIARDASGNTADILVYAATISLVTYETTPRAVDRVITTASAYYGPRFDYDPSTLVPKGLLIEEARTNLLLNSKADATNLSTQSVTVSATPYTLSFYGTGTVTLSGASTAGPLTGSGAFPTRSTLTFTPTAGTLTLTVTGTVQYANLEAASFATSYIPTAASSVTRAADDPRGTGTVLVTLQGQQASVVAEVSGTLGANTSRTFVSGVVTGNPIFASLDPSNRGATWDGTSAVATSNTASTGAARIATSWDASGHSIDMNGGPVATSAVTLTRAYTSITLGNENGTLYLNGWLSKLAIYGSRLSDATLQAKSVVGAPF